MTGDRVAEIRALLEAAGPSGDYEGLNAGAEASAALAYLLAELESANRRLAAVEALADSWTYTGPEPINTPTAHVIDGAVKALRAALATGGGEDNAE